MSKRTVSRYAPYFNTAYRVGSALVNQYNSRKRTRNGRVIASTRRRGQRQLVEKDGVYRGNFRRPRPLKKKTQYPCVVKTEYNGSYTTTATGYVVHATHPPRYVMLCTAMCFVQKYMKDNDYSISNWDDKVGIRNGLGIVVTPTLSCWAYKQSTLAAAGGPPSMASLGALVNGDTFIGLAQRIADGLTAFVANGDYAFMLTQIQWRVTDAPGASISGAVWDATELYLTIQGTSVVNLQNRTAAGDLDGSLNTDNVYANPLIGKHYHLSGYGARIKNIGYDITAKGHQIIPNSSSGAAFLDSEDAANSNAARVVLKQPVNGNYFSNCKASSSIRLPPGGIKKSSIFNEKTLSLNGWLKAMYPFISLPASITLATVPDYVTYRVGESAIIALEKLVDLNVSNVTIAYERDGMMKARMVRRPRNFIPATNLNLPT